MPPRHRYEVDFKNGKTVGVAVDWRLETGDWRLDRSKAAKAGNNIPFWNSIGKATVRPKTSRATCKHRDGSDRRCNRGQTLTHTVINPPQANKNKHP